MAVSKEALFKPRLAEETVEIPDVGEVRIRALSRSEVLGFRKRKVDGVDEMERVLVAAALVDPKLTEAEVGQWQDASDAGELELLTRAIQELSNMDAGAAKEAVKRFRSGSGT